MIVLLDDFHEVFFNLLPLRFYEIVNFCFPGIVLAKKNSIVDVYVNMFLVINVISFIKRIRRNYDVLVFAKIYINLCLF